MNPSQPIPARTRQLLLSLADAPTSATAQVQRYERSINSAEWQPFGDPLAASLGRSGLAWGRGWHPPVPDEPCKQEGDGKTPAGIFPIESLFGKAAMGSDFVRRLRLPYREVARNLKAVDDPASRHYNQIVDQTEIAHRDWASCEDMWRDDTRYDLGAVVGHNRPNVQPGGGSCIFLHVWAGPGIPTAGCTAFSANDMATIAAWLDAQRLPVLLQMTRNAYAQWQVAWGLPDLQDAGQFGDSSRPDR